MMLPDIPPPPNDNYLSGLSINTFEFLFTWWSNQPIIIEIRKLNEEIVNKISVNNLK
jgi:hypothetical protein